MQNRTVAHDLELAKALTAEYNLQNPGLQFKGLNIQDVFQDSLDWSEEDEDVIVAIGESLINKSEKEIVTETGECLDDCARCNIPQFDRIIIGSGQNSSTIRRKCA